jgi:hypothetical protein
MKTQYSAPPDLIRFSGDTTYRADLSETDRWVEPLEENFTRVLAQDLAVLLRTDRIVAYPWSPERKPTYRMDIEVFRFEANEARDAPLRWMIIDHTGKKPTIVKESYWRDRQRRSPPTPRPCRSESTNCRYHPGHGWAKQAVGLCLKYGVATR